MIDTAFLVSYIPMAEWNIEYTGEFEHWWNSLSQSEQIAVDSKIRLLQGIGPALGRPHVGGVKSSKHPNMKELRIQHDGRPYRVLFAFDPRRSAILLIGGDKTGDNRWYKTFVPLADRLFSLHLEQLKKEERSRG